MLRIFVRLLLAFGVILLAAPFVLSSLYLDERGITIPGRVHAKSEYVTTHYAEWHRASDVTIEYGIPETGGVSYFHVSLDPDGYDAFHVGQPVTLHYLLARDVPAVPMAQALRQMHALPMVRLAGQRAFSGLAASSAKKVPLVYQVLVGVIGLLVLWRVTRLPGFTWAFGICIFALLILLYLTDFPRPTRRPAVDVRKADGKVKSIERIDRIFSGNRSQGFDADQPIAVVGVEFVPSGRTDTVLAVDLIDAGSIPGLKENAAVSVDYEARCPRNAYIQKATRNFVARNVTGIVTQTLACLVVLIVGLGAAHFIGRGYNRLVQRGRSAK